MTIDKALAMQLMDLQHKLQELHGAIARLGDPRACPQVTVCNACQAQAREGETLTHTQRCPVAPGAVDLPRMCSEVDETEPDLTRCPSAILSLAFPAREALIWLKYNQLQHERAESGLKALDDLEAALTTAEAQRDALAEALKAQLAEAREQERETLARALAAHPMGNGFDFNDWMDEFRAALGGEK